MSNIPTAEELARIEYDDDRPPNIFMERQVDMKWTIFMMQRFAKLHVEAALEAGADNAQAKENPADFGTGEIWVDRNSILNAYPKENVK